MEVTVKRLTASLFSRFRTSERGAILVEALLIVPVITLFALAVVEFGFIFWERQQLQAGVRDAARYLSRCNVEAYTATTPICSLDKATALATSYFYPTGTTAGVVANRMPGTVLPTISYSFDPPLAQFQNITTDTVISVTGTFSHFESPAFSLLRLPAVPLTYKYSVRYIGW